MNAEKEKAKAMVKLDKALKLADRLVMKRTIVATRLDRAAQKAWAKVEIARDAATEASKAVVAARTDVARDPA